MAEVEATEVENCRGVLKIYSDGSIVRSPQPGFPVPYADDSRVEWKDLIFDHTLGLQLRLYIPTEALATQTRMPIFVYFHGGGYCIGSRTWGNFHNYCQRLTLGLKAVVVAPDYRVGPEHRLPASLDDGFAAIQWIRSQAEVSDGSVAALTSADPSLADVSDGSAAVADPWLAHHADFARVYVSGDSAGGGIAYHVSIRAVVEPSWGRMQIKGYVLLMAFFGGQEHTPSEATCPADAFLNCELNDRYWRLSLPVGADRDHPYSNPFGPGAPDLKELVLAPVLVIAGGCDLLRDREIEYAEKLKEYGKEVELVVYEGQQHGFFTITPDSHASKDLMDRIIAFMEAHQ